MDELAAKLRRRAEQFGVPFPALFDAVDPVARPDMHLSDLREYEHRKPGFERYTLEAARKWARDLDVTLHNHGMMTDLVAATGLPPEQGAEKVVVLLDAVSELANLLTLTKYGEMYDGRRQYEVAELLPRLAHVWDSAGHEKSNYWNPTTHQIEGRGGKHHAPASDYCQFLYWVTDDAFGMQKAQAVHGFLNSTSSGR